MYTYEGEAKSYDIEVDSLRRHLVELKVKLEQLDMRLVTLTLHLQTNGLAYNEVQVSEYLHLPACYFLATSAKRLTYLFHSCFQDHIIDRVHSSYRSTCDDRQITL